MGRYYARLSGETPEVAQAIYEHYLPRATGDKVPSLLAALIVGIADRLDSITGLFVADLAPTGTKDPYAQRRTAIGLVQSLIDWDLDFDLPAAIRFAAAHQPIKVQMPTWLPWTNSSLVASRIICWNSTSVTILLMLSSQNKATIQLAHIALQKH